MITALVWSAAALALAGTAAGWIGAHLHHAGEPRRIERLVVAALGPRAARYMWWKRWGHLLTALGGIAFAVLMATGPPRASFWLVLVSALIGLAATVAAARGDRGEHESTDAHLRWATLTVVEWRNWEYGLMSIAVLTAAAAILVG